MANMGYCRFENTLEDLRDCWEHMDDGEDLSEDEASARRRMIKLCARIAEQYKDELEQAA